MKCKEKCNAFSLCSASQRKKKKKRSTEFRDENLRAPVVMCFSGKIVSCRDNYIYDTLAHLCSEFAVVTPLAYYRRNNQHEKICI